MSSQNNEVQKTVTKKAEKASDVSKPEVPPSKKREGEAEVKLTKMETTKNEKENRG